MPAVRSTIKPTIVTRFAPASTSGGYEVVDDRDGRPVSGTLTWREAQAAAAELNEAALSGRKALARALGAIEDDELEAA